MIALDEQERAVAERLLYEIVQRQQTAKTEHNKPQWKLYLNASRVITELLQEADDE